VIQSDDKLKIVGLSLGDCRVNYSRTDKDKLSELHQIAERGFEDARQVHRTGILGRETPAERRQARQERDVGRGYSINVKQVVLAFTVEFWIIGLIIIGTYLLIAESGDRRQVSNEEIFSALLLPAALAMVELARVPLAIAVRTQHAWHIKFFASLGVLAAITVTSFSLSQIAWKTFDIRTAEATRAGDKLAQAKENKNQLQTKILQSKADLAQKIHERDSVNDRLGGLEQQLTRISTSSGTTCKPTLGPDGKPVVGDDGKTLQTCGPTATINQAQLNAVKTQIASTKKELEVAQAALKQTEEDGRHIDPQQIDKDLATADAEYRTAVNKSQIYSYAGMLSGKAGADVTDADVKRLEKFLIIIPSIAAAFASTLLAITAVRRIKPEEPAPTVTIPDEAAKYLFGPLLDAIRAEARDSVAAAISGKMAVPSGGAKASAPPSKKAAV
jgi:hypothetical protein